MARWKACGRLYIRRNWTFSLSPTVETLWAEIGRSRRYSKGGGSLWAQISDGRGRRPPTIVGIRVAEWLRFVWYKNICSASFSFVTMHACDRRTDGQTDRITTPKTALAYARAVKMAIICKSNWVNWVGSGAVMMALNATSSSNLKATLHFRLEVEMLFLRDPPPTSQSDRLATQQMQSQVVLKINNTWNFYDLQKGD